MLDVVLYKFNGTEAAVERGFGSKELAVLAADLIAEKLKRSRSAENGAAVDDDTREAQ